MEKEAFKEKALEPAAKANLVSNEELDSLNAKMHVSRGGQLTPYGDPHGVLAETKAGDKIIRLHAKRSTPSAIASTKISDAPCSRSAASSGRS
jgi:hypothetical protein